MTNDSLNLDVMRSNQLYDIATNDGDFERVEDIKVWKQRWGSVKFIGDIE